MATTSPAAANRRFSLHGYTVMPDYVHRTIAKGYGHFKSYHEAYDQCRKPSGLPDFDGEFGVIVVKRPSGWKPKTPGDRPRKFSDDCRLEHQQMALPIAAWYMLKYNRSSLARNWSTWAVIGANDSNRDFKQRFERINEMIGRSTGRVHLHQSIGRDREWDRWVSFTLPHFHVDVEPGFLEKAEAEAMKNVRTLFRELGKAWRQTEPKPKRRAKVA